MFPYIHTTVSTEINYFKLFGCKIGYVCFKSNFDKSSQRHNSDLLQAGCGMPYVETKSVSQTIASCLAHWQAANYFIHHWPPPQLSHWVVCTQLMDYENSFVWSVALNWLPSTISNQVGVFDYQWVCGYLMRSVFTGVDKNSVSLLSVVVRQELSDFSMGLSEISRVT